MAVIGLTGGIGSGKSTVSAMLKEMGAVIIDADAISHALTAPGGKALVPIREAFGDSVFDGEALLRARLAQLVFGQAAMREKLNAILHPMIYREMACRIDRAKADSAKLVVLDIPLLFETGIEIGADEIWVVSAPEEAQLARVMTRDGLTREQALARIAAQMPLQEKCKKADVILDNGKDLASLRAQVAAQVARVSDGEEVQK